MEDCRRGRCLLYTETYWGEKKPHICFTHCLFRNASFDSLIYQVCSLCLSVNLKLKWKVFLFFLITVVSHRIVLNLK